MGQSESRETVLARAKAQRQGGRAPCRVRNESSKDAAGWAGEEKGKKGPRKGVKGEGHD